MNGILFWYRNLNVRHTVVLRLLLLFVIVNFFSCVNRSDQKSWDPSDAIIDNPDGSFKAYKTRSKPFIDGKNKYELFIMKYTDLDSTLKNRVGY